MFTKLRAGNRFPNPNEQAPRFCGRPTSDIASWYAKVQSKHLCNQQSSTWSESMTYFMEVQTLHKIALLLPRVVPITHRLSALSITLGGRLNTVWINRNSSFQRSQQQPRFGGVHLPIDQITLRETSTLDKLPDPSWERRDHEQDSTHELCRDSRPQHSSSQCARNLACVPSAMGIIAGMSVLSDTSCSQSSPGSLNISLNQLPIVDKE